MATKIAKWGNSYAVRLPKETIERLSLKEGSSVVVSTESTNIKIQPIKTKEILSELISRINRTNRHELIDFVKIVGKELW